MFRTLLRLTLFSSLSTAVGATDLSLEPNADGEILRSASYASAIVDAHIQAQLDWRSYYLNHVAAGRDGLPRGKATWFQSPAEQTN